MSDHPETVPEASRTELVEQFGFRADRPVLLMRNSEVHLQDLLEAFFATARKRISPIEFGEFKPSESCWYMSLVIEGMRAVEGGVPTFVRNDMWDSVESVWELRGYGYLISDRVDDTPLKGEVVVQTPPMYFDNQQSRYEMGEFVVQFLNAKPVDQMHYVLPGDLEM